MAWPVLVLALANATAYSCTLFDPVVVLVALLTALARGGPAGRRRPGALLTVTRGACSSRRALLGGTSYEQRDPPDHAGPGGRVRPGASVLQDTWTWTGVILVLAVGGIIASWRQPRGGARQTWLLAVLAAAALPGPLEQAHLHTLDALNKHVGLGLWFAAIAAGYAMRTFIAAAQDAAPQAETAAACVIALMFPAPSASTQSTPSIPAGRIRPSFIAIFRPLAAPSSGPSPGRKTPPLPSTTCPPGTTGGAGPPPATSSCPAGPRRPPAPRPVSETGIRHLRPLHRPALLQAGRARTSADTIGLDHSIAADLTTGRATGPRRGAVLTARTAPTSFTDTSHAQ